MSRRKLTIFVSHPSDFMTDNQPHGDGLAAFEIIRRLALRGHSLHVAVPSMSLSKTVPHGVWLHPVKHAGRISALRPFEYIMRVRGLFRRIHRKHPIDVIHQLNPVNSALSSGLAYAGVPVVLGVFWSSWPASDAERRGSRLGMLASALTRHPLLALDRLQQRRATALLLSTPAAAVSIHDLAASSSRVHLLPYGVDTTQFSPSSAPATPALEILFLGSLTQRKGIMTLLAAFEAVVRRVPECRLRIAGVGPEEGVIREVLASSPWRQSVDLVGPVARPLVPELLRRCSMLCVPSLGEPFGLVALEAMASGKPVVGTDAGGLGHLIPARGGRKVPPGDSAALANALVELLQSPALCSEMGKFNRALVESSYSWESVIERLEAIYHQIVEAPRAATA